MIDYIKLETARLNTKNSPIIVRGEYEINTGEDLTKSPTSFYKDFKILYKPTKTFIQGSIHKSEFGHNGGDFSYPNFVESINNLLHDLMLDSNEVEVRSLEFGVNIILPDHVPVDQFCKNWMIFNGKRPSFKRWPDKTIYLECKLQQYNVKLYDKSKQLKKPELGNLLRIELHVNKMAYLSNIGISTLSDLLNPIKFLMLRDKLEEVCRQLIFRDRSIPLDELSVPEQKIYNNWKDSYELEDLFIANKKKYRYQKRKFFEIVSRHSRFDARMELARLTVKKFEDLFYLDQKTWYLLTDLLEETETIKLSLINHLNKGLISPNSIEPKLLKELHSKSEVVGRKRVCKITGLNISDQKKGSKFISAKKVGYKEAHRVRNRDSNIRNNTRKRIEKLAKRNELFPLNETISNKERLVELFKPWEGTQFDILPLLFVEETKSQNNHSVAISSKRFD